jgi:hypothetical protein
MNNNAVMLYGDPLGGGGNGLGTDGNGQDFDIGKSASEEAEGVFQMHGDSVLRIADDLKIADGSGGHARFVMDGNAKATIGSGISGSGVSEISISGNALLVTGNSADPGDTQAGRTNEGYLTLSGERSTVNVADNARLYVRSLQKRDGETTITLRNNGQFHVFDPFEHAAPDLGNATVTGSVAEAQRTSHISQNPSDVANIYLYDSAMMTFDTALDDSTYAGLALSGGSNTGATSEGGFVSIEVHDQATFAVAQDLHMAFGTGESAETILKVFGPDAKVNIGGSLRMAINEVGDENLGTATLHEVITGNSHGTITVGDTAFIGNGHLLVELDGYTPQGGESYQLMTAGTIMGSEFESTTLPALPDGLSWNLTIDATNVTLRVSQPGDFNGNGQLDAGDIDALSNIVRLGTNEAAYDVTGDNLVDAADRDRWVNTLRKTYYGDANLDGEFSSADFVAVFSVGKYETNNIAQWAEGDWNGDARFDSSDFVTAFQAGGYELGPRAAVSAVPEPSALVLLAIASIGVLRRRRA